MMDEVADEALAEVDVRLREQQEGVPTLVDHRTGHQLLLGVLSAGDEEGQGLFEDLLGEVRREEVVGRQTRHDLIAITNVIGVHVFFFLWCYLNYLPR